MRNDERFRKFFSGEKLDRLPCIEWATWWDKTLISWYSQGLDSDLDGCELKNEFGMDCDRQLWLRNLTHGYPVFKENGIISNEAEYEKLRPFLFGREILEVLKEDLRQIGEAAEKNGDVVWFTLSGYFWFPRELFGIEDHLYSFYDYPELYHRICSDMTEYYLLAIDELTKYVSPQFMTFAEDMSYNLGPMLSEETFNTFIKPYYRQLIPNLKSKGIRVMIDSDGDVTKMIPWLTDAGIEGILPLERQAGVDVNELTRQYPDFFFIGGFDKMVMKFGQEAMRNEFERLLPAIQSGRYLPSVDHQTPPDVSLENYKIYVRLMKEYCSNPYPN